MRVMHPADEPGLRPLSAGVARAVASLLVGRSNRLGRGQNCGMRIRRSHRARARFDVRTVVPPRGGGRLQHATPAVASSSIAGPLGYLQVPLPAGSSVLPPLERGDQGISASERGHAERAMAALFDRAGGVNWIATWDQDNGWYELRSRTGVIRWDRWRTPDGEVRFRILGIDGQNPVPSVDPTALRTLEEEVAAAGGPGRPVPADRTSYPDLLQRISQLFDSPRAPDFVYIPTGGGDPNHPGSGSHGVPDISQSRAPLIMAGPGIRRGEQVDTLVKSVDVAPTIAEFLGVHPVTGTNATGVKRTQLLKWQDGNSLAAAVSDARRGAGAYGRAERALVFVLDGGHQPILLDEVARGNLPNIARLMRMGVTFRNGSLVDYPTVTFANHNTLLTGASPGHQGILNNSWYERSRGFERLVTDGPFTNTVRAGRHMSPKVETLYEAVRRSFGPHAVTMALNQPSGRGSTIGTLELNGIGRMIANLWPIARGYLSMRGDEDPVYRSEPDYHKGSWMDRIGIAVARAFINGSNPPRLAVFELGLTDAVGHKFGPNTAETRAAFREADRNIGRVLGDLERRGLLDSSMIVVTADHGMEHGYTEPSRLGGWFDALRTSGVKTVESTRFVYVKSVRYSVHGERPRVGVRSELAIRVVNDDENEQGFRPAVTGARVTVRDASGHEWQASTDAGGVARVEVDPSVAGDLELAITHPAFTTEHGSIPVDGGVGAAASGRGRRRHGPRRAMR